MRTGPFRSGDRVQLTDSKGRMSTITLVEGEVMHTHKGSLAHEDLLGHPEGTLVTTSTGTEYLALRPLLSDYVLSMPRGATIVYPKDAAQIIMMADIFPGARVLEAGVGSGGLTLSLLRAVGDGGSLLSIERREDFAEVARGNVEVFFGGEHPAWEVQTGDFADVAGAQEAQSVDRIVLDMLAPWENIEASAHALVAGGVLCMYVATTTQMARVVDALKDDGRWTEPDSWETIVRGWHLEGLAVRPEHRMVGHTGFLITARRLAPGGRPPTRKRRPAPGAYTESLPEVDPERLATDMKEQPVPNKKLRRARRTQEATLEAQRAAEAGDEEGGIINSMERPPNGRGPGTRP